MTTLEIHFKFTKHNQTKNLPLHNNIEISYRWRYKCVNDVVHCPPKLT